MWNLYFRYTKRIQISAKRLKINDGGDFLIIQYPLSLTLSALFHIFAARLDKNAFTNLIK